MATQVTQVSGQQSIPTELMPYFTGTGTAGQAGYVPGLLPKGQEVFARDYATTYAPLIGAGLSGAGGIASLSPMQQQVGTEIGQMGTPSQFNMGMGAAGSAYGILGGNMPSITNQGLMQQYMSPYQQNVVDVQKQEAIRDAQKGMMAQNLGSVKQGTYGGARQLLAQTELDRNLQTNLGRIQAQGLQSAYEAGQKGLEAERTARLQQGTALGSLSDVFTRAGTAEQAADIDRLKTMGAYGDLERGYQQQLLDARKDELTRQSEFGAAQLGSMANLLRGVPLYQSSETKAQTTPPPSFASQLGGLGLTGLSMYNMLQGR
jgi:hypothetical protein